MKLKNIIVPSDVKTKMEAIQQQDHDAYIVGGAVRDGLLGKPVSDWDIFTDATGEEILEIFPNGKIIGNEERQNRILTVVVDGIEISSFRKSGDRTETGKSLHDHQATCDYTINALAANIDGILIGESQWLNDIKNHRLRFVGQPDNRITEDPLRILRGMRFASFGFSPTEDTVDAWATYQDILKDLPIERIVGEIDKCFSKSRYPSIMLGHMWATGLLKHILPEIYYMKNSMQNPWYHPYPYNDVWSHVLHAVDMAKPEYRWHTLLHDVGKYVTGSYDKDKKHNTFHGHAEAGADMIPDIAARLKLPNKLRDEIIVTTRLHMRAHTVSTKRGIRKLQAEAGDHLEALKEVCMADCADRKEFNEAAFIQLPPEEVRDYAVTGKYLIDKGIESGPEMGKIIDACFKIQLDNGIIDPDEIYDMYNKQNEEEK